MTSEIQVGDSLIHLSNLPNEINEDTLMSIFSEYGKILKIELRIRPSGNFAFIQYDNPESAINAMTELNYTKINNDPIIITHATVENMRAIHSGFGLLFLRGLSDGVEPEQLHELFSNYGPVISVKMPSIQSKNRGYAYIQFRNPEDADRARLEIADATLDGKTVQCEAYVRKDTGTKPAFVNRKHAINDTFTTIFVRNLPPTIKNLSDLVNLCSSYGKVSKARFIVEKSAGFLDFESHDSAAKAVAGLNGHEINGFTILALRALTKEERIAFSKLSHKM